ncbi:MAG: hypothetical protein SGJ05_01870 [bacterium]|nr:hypothetical protein [bacterium]
MISTVYLHPDRTLRATWSVDADNITLTSFDDNAMLEQSVGESFGDGLMNDTSNAAHTNGASAITTVVLHTSQVYFHRYPVDADEDHNRRRFFEIITCLPPLAPEDRIIEVPMPGELHGSAWHGLLVIPQTHVPDGYAIDDVRVDILEDIRAARIADLLADEGITLLVGQRGDVWWCAVLDTSGTIQHLVQTPVHPAFETSVEIRDLVLEVSGSTKSRAERVIVFGDSLTKAILDDVTIALDGLTTSVVRMQPFRTLRADVDAATQQRCVRLAHMLGPLVGPLPCASLQES